MSHNLLGSLKSQRDKHVADQRKLLDDIEARMKGDDSAGMTAEDTEAIGRFDTSISELDERMKQVAEAISRAADLDASITDVLDSQSSRDDGGKGSDVETDAKALRAVATGERRAHTFSPPDAEQRDLLAGTATDGKETVPVGFYDKLVEHMIESSAVLQAGPTTLDTQSGEPIQVPVTTSYSTGAIVAEAAAIPESDPQFAQRTLGAYKYGVMIQVSTELLIDTAINLVEFISRQAGRAIGNAFGAHLVSGTGTGQPLGVATSATAGVTAALNADSMIDLFYSVIAPYRSTASFLTSDANLAAIRKLKDGAGQYLWTPAQGPGVPDSFLGKSIYSDPNILAHAAGVKSVLFGDFATYFVRRAGGVRIERSDDYAFANDLVTFRVLLRGDGTQADQTGAIKALVGA